jgi:hypothetical protein
MNLSDVYDDSKLGVLSPKFDDESLEGSEQDNVTG